MIYGIVGLESELFTIYPLSVLNHNSIKPNYLCYTLSVYILYPFCDIVGLGRRFISVASPFCSYPLSGFFFTITFMIFPPFICKEDTSSLLLRFADVSTLRSWLTGAFYTSTLFLNWNSSENRTNTDTQREREVRVSDGWWSIGRWRARQKGSSLWAQVHGLFGLYMCCWSSWWFSFWLWSRCFRSVFLPPPSIGVCVSLWSHPRF